MFFRHISPAFFETLGVQVIAGRPFRDADRPGAPRVAIVNEAASRLRFSGAPLGRRLVMKGFGRAIEYEVVGVVRDSRQFSLRERASAAMVYLPVSQPFVPVRALHVAVRIDPTVEAAGRIAGIAADVDREVPVSDLKPQLEQIQGSIARERTFASLLTFFAGFALFLACIGLYTVTAHAVARRTSEIGVRMALGAAPRHVLWMVFRQALAPAAVGLVLGLPIAIAGARALRTMLFDLEPGDPLSIATAAGAVFIVAIASGYLPARRATRADPLTALRAE
jgi:ABC-type antimicrobial peptide transport system permease subunit